MQYSFIYFQTLSVEFLEVGKRIVFLTSVRNVPKIDIVPLIHIVQDIIAEEAYKNNRKLNFVQKLHNVPSINTVILYIINVEL